MQRNASHCSTCLLASLVVISPAITAQAPPDSTFDQRARAAWTAVADSPTELRGGTLPLAIARLAGLEFQEEADRLTPDLDSALALSVMSGGKLRESPWGWFAYARQLQHSRGSCLPYAEMSPRQWFGYCRRVAGAYRQALKLDSLFLPMLIDLDDAIPWPALWLEPDQELRLLSRALAQSGVPSSIHRRLERRRLLVWSSVDAENAVRAIIVDGDAVFSPGELSFLEARSLASKGDGIAAANAYSRAASLDGPGDHLDWIRGDVELIGSPADPHDWDALPADKRQEWVAAFWDRRDLNDGRELGTRIVHHAQRWQRSFRDYRYFLEDVRLDGGGAFVAPSRECPLEDDGEDLTVLVLHCNYADSTLRVRIFDDRGLTYIRHGEPQQRANYPGMQNLTKESWLYRVEDGLLAIHFDKGLDPVARNGMRKRVVANGDWMTACQVVPRYCVLAGRQSLGERIPPERMRMVRERGEEEMIQLLTTDGAPQRFRGALKFNAGAYALGSGPGRLTLAVDAPLEELRKLAGNDSTRVVLRWQVRIRGSDGMWPVSSDMNQTLTLPPSGTEGDAGKILTLVREFAVPPGRYDLRLVLSDSAGTTGAMYSRDGFAMIGGTAPNLSDLVLMPDGTQGAARTIEGVPARISPTFTPGAARFVQVGYVLTGFAGRDVRVTVRVTEAGKSDDEPRVAVTFTERPATDRDFRTQRLGLKRLGNGAWDLSVSVPLPDGTTVTRTQRILVRR